MLVCVCVCVCLDVKAQKLCHLVHVTAAAVFKGKDKPPDAALKGHWNIRVIYPAALIS